MNGNGVIATVSGAKPEAVQGKVSDFETWIATAARAAAR
jgi:hypothetical protein